MAALNKDRNTPERTGDLLSLAVAGTKKIYAGALVALTAAGYATPGATSATLVGVGRAEEQVDNTNGADGDVSVRVRTGAFRWANSAGGDEITIASIGDACYMVDDQTVAKTDGGGTRSKAGIVADVDAQGVWVATGPGILNSPAASLLAANNLSDVANKATSRGNLGVYEKLGAPAIAVGAEAVNAITVTVQLKDSANANVAARYAVKAYLSTDAEGDNVAAVAPTGGVAAGANGVVIEEIADKSFVLVTNATGEVDVVITDAGAPTFYLILVMPDGSLVASGAITFA